MTPFLLEICPNFAFIHKNACFRPAMSTILEKMAKKPNKHRSTIVFTLMDLLGIFQKFVISYRNMHVLDLISPIFEKFTKNVSLMTALFSCTPLSLAPLLCALLLICGYFLVFFSILLKNVP